MGSSFLVSKTNQSSATIKRDLIAFNIADTIPVGSTVIKTDSLIEPNLQR
ncbi:MAG: hypothetical protein AAF298_15250 [Cyanobacteria bacterium P01_A01_bin.40]